MKLEHPESYYDLAYLDWLKDKEDRKVERVVGDIIHNMSDKEFFVDDPGDYRDFIYDEIEYWYSQAEERPIVHDYAYKEKDTQWMTWARYCYEAACRDNPLALAKYAWFCEHGVECEQNLKTAAECYTRGAELGEIHCIRATDRMNKFKNEGTNEDNKLPKNDEVIQYKTDDRSFRYWEAKELAFSAELLKLRKAERIEILMESRDDPSKI